MAITATIVAVAGLGTSIYEGNQQQKASKSANNFQKQQADLQAQRQKVDAIRQSRLAAASAVQAGANQGVSNSSAVQGGVGSIISQGNSNVSFLDHFNYLSDQASIELGKAQTAGFYSQSAAGVSSLAVSIFGSGIGQGKKK